MTKVKTYDVVLHYKCDLRVRVAASSKREALDAACAKVTEKHVMENLIEDQDAEVEERK